MSLAVQPLSSMTSLAWARMMSMSSRPQRDSSSSETHSTLSASR